MIDNLAHESSRRQDIPGITLAVVDHGQVVYSHAFGRSDVENDVAATSASEIRTASIAKPMTALAAMVLASTGKLDLDAPVQQYCPAFPFKTSPDGKPWVVTTRELLSHRAGVRWYHDDVELRNVKHYANLSEAVRHFGDDPLLFAPGEKMQYSSYGFVVIGCAIEGASRSTFIEYMQQAVFGPAGMAATFPDDPAKIIPHRSRGYEKAKEGTLENAPLFDPSDRLPGGGWLSTSEDLARFAAAVMAGKVVALPVLEEMWKPLTVQDDEWLWTGLGCCPARRASRHRTQRRTGRQQHMPEDGSRASTRHRDHDECRRGCTRRFGQLDPGALPGRSRFRRELAALSIILAHDLVVDFAVAFLLAICASAWTHQINPRLSVARLDSSHTVE
jgi:CubicO group peptidase (beta-lactamase class C family)